MIHWNHKPEEWRSALFVFSAALLGAVALLALFSVFNNLLPSAQTPNDTVGKESAENPFERVSLSAKAAYVLDAKTGQILWAQNDEMQLPLASIAKLMTAIVAAENLTPERIVRIGATELAEDGDNGLIAGERWRAEDLIDFTLIVSSNDGARALAAAATLHAVLPQENALDGNSETYFTRLMNEKGAEIDLPQTYFLNESGLDSTQWTSGGYGSARDAAYLLLHALLSIPRLLETTRLPEETYTSLDNFQHTVQNTNEIVGRIPGLIASKTGFTDLAGGNLAVAFDAGVNRPILIAILGSTRAGRFEDMEQLVNAVLAYLALQPRVSPLE